MTEFISVVGVPKQIPTDQGKNFDSHLFHRLCELLDIEKTRTSPFRAQSDGQVERWNQTVQQMLKSFINDNRDDWDDHLPYLCMAYRATPHECTSVSPNLMMFGTEINMPIDVMVGTPPHESNLCPVQYVEWIKQSLKHAYTYATKQLNANAQRQKHNYDLKSKPTSYDVGSYVWRWYWPAARGKLGKGWVGPFSVMECPTCIHCIIQKSPEHPKVRVHIDALKPYFGERPEVWENYTDMNAENEDDTEASSHTSSESEQESKFTTPQESLSSSDEQIPEFGRGCRQRKKPIRYSP